MRPSPLNRLKAEQRPRLYEPSTDFVLEMCQGLLMLKSEGWGSGRKAQM